MSPSNPPTGSARTEVTQSPAHRTVQRLVFIYAADAGRLSALADSAKKLLRIQGCSLCSITHGLAGEKSDWRACRDEIGVPVEIHHRDDMPPEVAEAAGGRLPCVLADTGDDLVLLLGPEVLDRMQGNVADFKGRLRTHAAMRRLTLPEAATA